MTPQEIMDRLADIEEAAFYGMHNPDGISYEAFEQLHTDIKTALLNYHRLTGLKTS